MKKFGVLIFILAIIVGVLFANLTSFGKVSVPSFSGISFGRGIKGSGNIASEKRDVSEFRSVEVSGVIQTEIVLGKAFSVEVEADDNLLPYIKTEVSNGRLEIYSEKKLKPRAKLLVRVTAPDLEGVNASGVAKISVDGVSNESFKIDSSGASKVSVIGKTSQLNLDVSGASRVDASQLSGENVFVDASGASNASVNATSQLRADASGASKIRFSGNPTNLVKNVSGAGKIYSE